MENTEGQIKVFFAGPLPKTKYTDANELAQDLANALAIKQESLIVNLISLPDIKGEKGDKGDKGATGPKGEKGDTGATGATGASGAGLSWEGVWTDTTVYAINDIVENGGNNYICILNHIAEPDNEPGIGVDEATYWALYSNVVGLNTQPVVTLVDGATVTWTADTNVVRQNAEVTIVGNRTLAFAGWADGMHGTLKITQGAGAPWTMTLPGTSKVAGGGAGVVALSAGVGAIDILEVFYDGTNYFVKSSLNYT
jgi:hypothetical protein